MTIAEAGAGKPGASVNMQALPYVIEEREQKSDLLTFIYGNMCIQIWT